MTTPANILLIQTDQHRYDCIAGHGHPIIRTPHLDRLIREGVTFSHAYCPSPVCRPSRASLMTGVWPTQHGVICNEDLEATAVLRPGLPMWSEVLAEGGYILGYVGKWQVDQKRDPTAFGFRDYVPAKGYRSWRKAQGVGPVPRRNGFWGEADAEITPEQSRLAWGAGETIRLLQKACAAGRPFFIRWDTDEPHLPNIVPEPYASMYDPTTIPPWPSFRDRLEGKPYIQRQQLRSWGIEGWTWEQWAPIVARYLGEVSLIDSQIGRILDVLDALGLAKNTLVVYTTDHGDLCGGHGMADKHYVMYDDIARVPLILRWPGAAPTMSAATESASGAPAKSSRIWQTACGAAPPCLPPRKAPPGRPAERVLASGKQPAGLPARRDRFCWTALRVSSGIDLAATFCDAAGLAAPSTFVGHSLLPSRTEGVPNKSGTPFSACTSGTSSASTASAWSGIGAGNTSGT